MTFTDTHCHLADPALSARSPDILAEAQAAGVCRFIVPAARQADFAAVLSLAERPSVLPAVGLHPWFADEFSDGLYSETACILQGNPRVWVGEIGLDFIRAADSAARQRQLDVFRRQLGLAKAYRRRVIVHNVKAAAAVAETVKTEGFGYGGIVHAFSGSLEEAQMLIRAGFKIGIGSLLLNPTAKKVRQAVQQLDLRDIVLETDSPFMLKDGVNTPANVCRIAEIAAQLRGVSTEEIAVQTEKNVDALWDAV
ncbi:TatD family hydrolase [Neisseria sp.]|uniref:TatD family hydrolase n=1 Tax=Neisseria sp. TaxID=192066 RepID=UPI0035A1B093